MKKRYSDPLCYSAMMLRGGPELTGSQGGKVTDPEEPYEAGLLGINGDVVQDLEVNGTGGQEAAAENVQILRVPIAEQVTEEAAESALDKATGETDMETPGASVPEGE